MYFRDRRRTQLQDDIQVHVEPGTGVNVHVEIPSNEARWSARKKFSNVLLALGKSRDIWEMVREAAAHFVAAFEQKHPEPSAAS